MRSLLVRRRSGTAVDEALLPTTDQPFSATGWLYWLGDVGAANANQAERFASEALALAIRADPAPFFRAVRESVAALPRSFDGPLDRRFHRLASLARASTASTRTEYPVGRRGKGEGAVDIRVIAEAPDGPEELWIEIKVGAPISGAQLRTYAQARHAMSPSERALFMFVAKAHPCAGRAARLYPCLIWEDLATSIGESPRSRIWEELRRFIWRDLLERPERA